MLSYKIKAYLREFNFSANFSFNLSYFKRDLIGGLFAAIHTLPVAIAYGILIFTGDVTPNHVSWNTAVSIGISSGIICAIITGLLAALIGGVPQLISGPTAGMAIVLLEVFKIASKGGLFIEEGIQAVLLVILIGGIIQLIFGILKIGKYFLLSPYFVISGFYAGLALLLFIYCIKFFYLSPIVVVVTISTILILYKSRRNFPRLFTGAIVGNLLAIGIHTGFAHELFVNIFGDNNSIMNFILGSDYGGNIPFVEKLNIDLNLFSFDVKEKLEIGDLLNAGLALGILGTVETILSTDIVDNATNNHHHCNKEILANGFSNILSSIFGGIAGTGTITRTLTNIRWGGITQISAIISSIIILFVFIIFIGFDFIAAYITPVAFIGVLASLAYSMIDRDLLINFKKMPKTGVLVFIVIAIITVISITAAVKVALIVAAAFIVNSMSKMGLKLDILERQSKDPWYEKNKKLIQGQNDIAIYNVHGATFMGGVIRYARAIAGNFKYKHIILNMSFIQVLDDVMVVLLDRVHNILKRTGHILLIADANRCVLSTMNKAGLTKKIGYSNIYDSLQSAFNGASSHKAKQTKKNMLYRFFRPDWIMVDIEAKDKPNLFKILADRAQEVGLLNNKSEFIKLVNKRETEAITSLGKGIALPHAKTNFVKKTGIIMGVLREPIEYGSHDNQAVKYVFLIASVNNDNEYLDVLSSLVPIFREKEAVFRLNMAKDKEDFWSIFT